MKPFRSMIILGAFALSLVAVAPAAAGAPMCHGKRVTITDLHHAIHDQITDSVTQMNDHGTITVGTPHADVILLTHPGTVHALGGADIICGSGGADVIDAGSGNDIVLAGAGRDVVAGGSGRDSLFGEGGGDSLAGGAGADFVVGGAGIDRIARQGGDIVGSGMFGVSVSIPADGVALLHAAAQSLVFTRATSGLVPVIATSQPFEQNALSLAGYGAFNTTMQPFPGAAITPSGVVAVPLGSRVMIAIDQAMAVMGGGQQQSVTFTNGSAMTLTTGLAQQVSTMWMPSTWQPAFVAARATPPYASQIFTPTNQVTLFAASYGQAGVVLDGVPQNAATATLSDAHPTATFTWNSATNSFVAGTPQ